MIILFSVYKFGAIGTNVTGFTDMQACKQEAISIHDTFMRQHKNEKYKSAIVKCIEVK